jgi:DNA-binding transcriptional MerR regulator
MATRQNEPVQEFFSIGEVCALTDLKPHVLRYWESQFRFLSPAKTRAGNRAYQRREIEMILLVKHLLYTERYTIDGARQKLADLKQAGELRRAGYDALSRDTLLQLERDLADIVATLEGQPPDESTSSDAISRHK